MLKPVPSPPRLPCRRFVIACTAALVVATTLMSVAPAEAAVAGSPPRADAVVTVSDRRAAVGHRVTVSGAIRRASRPIAGQRVAVQQRTTGTATWHTFSTGTTTSGGRVSVTSERLSRSKEFRVQLLTGGVRTASTIAAVTVPTSVAVTATSPLTPTAGDAVVLAGTASPQLAGRRIYLQTLVGATWKTVASSQVSGDATFNVHGIATLGGDRDYRAMVKAAPGLPEAVTEPVEFTVFAWYRLADVASSAPPLVDRPLSTSRLVIGDVPYEQSVGVALQEGESGSGTWSLDDRCSEFRATLGAAAGSGAEFTGRWRLFADDDLVLERTLTEGATESVSGTITGTSDLQLRSFALSGSGATAWGNAEVLCAGRP